MDHLQLWTTLSLAPLATYALAAATAPLAAVPLIAATLLAIKAFLATAPNLFQALFALLLPLLSLTTGTSLSLALSSSPSATLSSSLDAFLALSLYALIASFAPLIALAAGELVLSLATKRRPGAGKSLTAVLVPAWFFVLAGIIEESAGTGRMGWWVRPALEREGVDWVRRVGGQVAVDLGVGAAGVAVAMVIWEWIRRREAGEGDLLGEGGGDEEARSSWRKSTREPLILFTFLTTLVLAGPLFPEAAFYPWHPSPSDPSYVYPPLKLACVVPPSLVTSSRHTTHAKLDDWLKETRVVARRGPKLLSWFEGAVELEKGARKDEGEGWEAMGDQERELLERVGEVHVLATYLVPPPLSQHNSKRLNVATLVGPSAVDTPTPNLVFSTTKQHPVPFIESYSHTARSAPSLGSSSKALPLAAVDLPHPPHTPAPHLTPPQTVSVSAAICQDISFPSLLTSYVSPSTSSADSPPKKPQLILNPSNTPSSLHGISHAQLAQTRARALETNSFVLRCDSPGAASGSALLGPQGDVRVKTGGEGVVGSWQAEVGVQRAGGGTLLTWIGRRGGRRFGSEAFVLFLAASLVVVVRLVEGGELVRAVKTIAWRAQVVKAENVVLWIRRKTAEITARRGEEGLGRVGPITEERLVDVD
ncbi:WD-repeat-containing protein [Rhodotorula toruloides]|uniref:WD-repeat-containing protein n=1 Tax=Rhodotorula toruloides TaxID=5286 RepID=A0A511KJ83_RHOTO|nr:WD-repeat-containing protein [Rhodotorula toruloides]